MENGPRIVYVDGKVLTAMCMCEDSSNKPYSDGTHRKVGFAAKPSELKVLEQ